MCDVMPCVGLLCITTLTWGALASLYIVQRSDAQFQSQPSKIKQFYSYYKQSFLLIRLSHSRVLEVSSKIKEFYSYYRQSFLLIRLSQLRVIEVTPCFVPSQQIVGQPNSLSGRPCREPIGSWSVSLLKLYDINDNGLMFWYFY